MDEKKILDMIKKSGENVDAPEEIHPERIRCLLEEQPVDKKSRFRRYAQWGAVAAVFALVIIGGVTGLTRLSGTNGGNSQNEAGTMSLADASQSTKATGETEIFEVTTENTTEATTEKTTTAQTSADVESGNYVFAGAKSYQEIFDALKKTESGYGGYETAELARDTTNDYMVEDSAMAAMDMESSETNAGAGFSYSKTNLQEAGVDEADVVKADGKYLYVMKATGSVRLIRAKDKDLQTEGTIMLDALNETPQEMYVDGDTLSLIVTGSKTTLNSDAEEDTYTADTENYTKLYTYDISDRSQPQLTGVVQQQGHYSTSRKNGDIVYLFTQFDPQVSDASEIDEYIPAVNGARMESSDIFLPEYQNSTSCLVISSVSTGKPDAIIDQKAVVSAAENFYVSENNIYISNTNWSSDVTMTQILKFSCQKGKIQAKGTADLKGSLNDSFSMNEYNSYLRVVLTDYSGETQKNVLYVLDDAMQVCGNIGDLAEGEDIRSARFLGDIGYFVTFRNTDPLFSVDLSNPSDPKILGELKITGFSSYLHFYGENKLLGVGNEVDPETGAYTGIKLAMFDVSDPSNVKQLHKFVIKDTYDCPLFYNYKAAMIDTEKNVFGFMCDSSYMVFCYDEEKGFENVFTENLGDSYYGYSYNGLQEVRGCFIGDNFYLVGGGQIRIYDMANDYKEVGRLEL